MSAAQSQNPSSTGHRPHAAQPDPRIRFFDALAPTWDQTGPDPTVTLGRLRDLQDHLGFRPGQNLLEVGCGTGQVTGWLRDVVCPGQVLSVDFSAAMLEQARRRLPAAEFALLDVCADPERSVECIQIDGGLTPPIPDRRFDVVWCFHVFPHLRDQAAALRNLAARLTPGGELLVVHLAGSTPLNAFHSQLGGAVGHDRLPSLPEFEPLLKAAGLRLIKGEDRNDLFLLRATRLG